MGSMATVNDISGLETVLHSVEEFIKQKYARKEPVSLSIGIVYDQELLWSKSFGFANIEQQIQATPATIYNIGSVTKPFTATAILQLRDAGKLGLDDPVSNYLPDFHVQSRFADTPPITFRQLLSHRAGLPFNAPTEPILQDNVLLYPSREEMQRFINGINLITAPMTQHFYSNVGFVVLGLAIEKITGMPYTEYVKKHILRPLGMATSSFEPSEDWPEEIQKRLATPYTCNARSQEKPVASLTYYSLFRGQNPAGGLYSSVKDMAQFVSLQFREGPASESQLLRGSTLWEMQASVFLSPYHASWKSARALSWGTELFHGHTMLGHEGGSSGFGADIRFIPALKLGVITLTNGATATNQLNLALLELLLPTFAPLAVQRVEAKRLSSLPPIEQKWKRYEGMYIDISGGGFEARLTANKFIALIMGQETLLQMTGEGEFQMLDGPFAGEYIHFHSDQNGTIIHATSAGFLFTRK